jgi:hypothetical protein
MGPSHADETIIDDVASTLLQSGVTAGKESTSTAAQPYSVGVVNRKSLSPQPSSAKLTQTKSSPARPTNQGGILGWLGGSKKVSSDEGSDDFQLVETDSDVNKKSK